MLSARSFPWNEAAVHRAEIPGANGIGTARSIARVYACLATGGAPLLSAGTVDLGRRTLSAGLDVLHAEERRFGVGFQLQTETMAYGPPPTPSVMAAPAARSTAPGRRTASATPTP